jgi:hypothetical protein
MNELCQQKGVLCVVATEQNRNSLKHALYCIYIYIYYIYIYECVSSYPTRNHIAGTTATFSICTVHTHHICPGGLLYIYENMYLFLHLPRWHFFPSCTFLAIILALVLIFDHLNFNFQVNFPLTSFFNFISSLFLFPFSDQQIFLGGGR